MTYSIVARDAATGELGVAVQSQAFNTGAAVPWARPGVGAVATQSFTDRRYGWEGLEMMAAGSPPEETLAHLRGEDDLVEFRQVGLMAADGRTAQWTGSQCVPDAGCARGDGWITQANMVESPRVWEAMGAAFESSVGSLAERLMSALDAAESEGGDWRGRGGAAIVVVPSEGKPWERVIDLRVEEGDESLVELRRLLGRALGYREANRATSEREKVGRQHNLPDPHVRRLALHDAVQEGRFAEARIMLAELETENPRWRDFFRTVSSLPEMDAFGRLLDEGTE